jgi:hypothetical protein
MRPAIVYILESENMRQWSCKWMAYCVRAVCVQAHKGPYDIGLCNVGVWFFDVLAEMQGDV